MRRTKFLIMAFLVYACGNDETIQLPDKGSQGSSVSLDDDQNKFDQVISSKSGDDFDILNAFIFNDYLEIELAYGGGCEDHSFELLWSVSEFNSMQIVEVVIVHDGNNDLCEAYLKEKLKIGLDEMPPVADSLSHHGTIHIINGSNLESLVIYEGLPAFPEGETCKLTRKIHSRQ